MNFDTKCKLLTTLWFSVGAIDDAGWEQTVKAFDLSFPYAFGVNASHLTLNDEGIRLVNDCWVHCCELLQVDPEGDYPDYNAWMNASPNPVAE